MLHIFRMMIYFPCKWCQYLESGSPPHLHSRKWDWRWWWFRWYNIIVVGAWRYWFSWRLKQHSRPVGAKCLWSGGPLPLFFPPSFVLLSVRWYLVHTKVVTILHVCITVYWIIFKPFCHHVYIHMLGKNIWFCIIYCKIFWVRNESMTGLKTK